MAAPFSAVGGYPSGPADSDGTPYSDPNKGIVPNVAAFTTPLGAATNAGGYGSSQIPVLSAILVELRVMNYLLWANSAVKDVDLAALRADEVIPASGGTIL